MNPNKIYIVSTDVESIIPLLDKLIEQNDEFQVASTFSTDNELADRSAERYQYYVSNDQLNLDYKNNALLYVDTDTITQNSVGIALDVYYNSNVIPMSVRAFNTIKENYYKDSLVIWIDRTINIKELGYAKYKLQMIEIKYFMNNFMKQEGSKDCLMYFNQNDSDEDIVSILIEYMEADDERKSELISENS